MCQFHVPQVPHVPHAYFNPVKLTNQILDA